MVFILKMCVKLVYVRRTIFLFLLGLLSSQGIISVGLEVQFPDKLCLKGLSLFAKSKLRM